MATVTTSDLLHIRNAIVDEKFQSDNGLVMTDGNGNIVATSISAAGSYNVLTYGATGNGSSDDTAAINAAVSAAQNSVSGGGEVILPAGTFKTSGPIIITSGKITLRGAGAEATTIKPASGSNFDVIQNPFPPDNSTHIAGPNGMVLRDFGIDCGNMSGTTAGQGNGIHLFAATYCKLINLHIINSKNWAIMNDSNSASDSYDNYFENIRTNSCAGGIRFESGEGSTIFHCLFYGANNTTTANQNIFRGGPSGDNNSYGLFLDTGNISVINTFFGGGGNITHQFIQMNGLTQFIGNSFDVIPAQSIHISSGAHRSSIMGNNFENLVTGTPCEIITLDADQCMIVGNTVQSVGTTNITYDIVESNAHTANVIADNYWWVGTSGVLSLNAGSTDFVAHNPNYNPVGAITPPAVPLTTVAYTNKFSVDCTVNVAASGATITAIAIGGTATGLTAGTFRVPSGQTIALTYSGGTPTWTWFGD